MSDSGLFDEVKGIVVESLAIQDRAAEITPSTELLGSLPELDSMAVLALLTTLESHFEITIEDEEFDGEIFDTMQTLTDFVGAKINQN